ncbi:unnamed protein product, partial [Ceratitis capitata]
MEIRIYTYTYILKQIQIKGRTNGRTVNRTPGQIQNKPASALSVTNRITWQNDSNINGKSKQQQQQTRAHMRIDQKSPKVSLQLQLPREN